MSGYPILKANKDEAHIAKRSLPIAYAIDARRKRFPEEKPFIYKPLAHKNIL